MRAHAFRVITGLQILEVSATKYARLLSFFHCLISIYFSIYFSILNSDYTYTIEEARRASYSYIQSPLACSLAHFLLSLAHLLTSSSNKRSNFEASSRMEVDDDANDDELMDGSTNNSALPIHPYKEFRKAKYLAKKSAMSPELQLQYCVACICNKRSSAGYGIQKTRPTSSRNAIACSGLRQMIKQMKEKQYQGI